jgi:hypothetical protein
MARVLGYEANPRDAFAAHMYENWPGDSDITLEECKRVHKCYAHYSKGELHIGCGNRRFSVDGPVLAPDVDTTKKTLLQTLFARVQTMQKSFQKAKRKSLKKYKRWRKKEKRREKNRKSVEEKEAS